MKRTIFTGAGVAIVTPFDENNKINFAELGRIIDNQIAEGTDAIVITGTTGESATLDDEEHKAAIKFAVEHTNKRVPVVAGTGSNDTNYAIQLSQYAEKVGADGLLLVTPYYNKCTQNGLVAHYMKIADSVSIPMIVYNVPSRTGVNIKPETYAKLAQHKNIVAAKEANGDLSAVLRTRRLCGDDLAIYSGNDDQIIPILSVGGKGVISVLSNVAPKDTHLICQLYFEGKVEAAAKLQIDYSDLVDALFCEVNPIPVKAAMKLLGWNVGAVRMPLSEIEPKNLELVKSALANHNLLEAAK